MTAEEQLAALVAASSLDSGSRGISAVEPEYRLDAERTLSRLATTLARLHAVVIRPAELLAQATLIRTPASLVQRAAAGTGQVGPAYRHMTRERLVRVLADGASALATATDGLASASATASDTDTDGLVLTNGAPTLANLRFDGPEVLGFADWSQAGLADPYLDLAVAARDVASVFGPAPIHAFFDQYGLQRVDAVRLDWYLLAAELIA